MKVIILILISLFFSVELDSIKILKNILYNNRDRENIKIDLNKTVGLNVVPDKVDKDRLSEFVLDKEEIQEIKKNAMKYKPSPLSLNETVVIETNKGSFKIKLFNDISPKHCYNFKKLCNSGFYDKTSFHRVIEDYMIQGGDILSRDDNRDNDGEGSPGWVIDEEFNDISHKRGIVSMVRSNDFNSAGSQFFICTEDSPWLDKKYTVFGEVIEGMDVVDDISKVTTDRDMILYTAINKIPEGELERNWIEIIDPVTKKKVFSKIPKGENKTSYTDRFRKEVRSYNPYRRVEISKARIYSDDSFNK